MEYENNDNVTRSIFISEKNYDCLIKKNASRAEIIRCFQIPNLSAKTKQNSFLLRMYAYMGIKNVWELGDKVFVSNVRRDVKIDEKFNACQKVCIDGTTLSLSLSHATG